MKRRVLVAVGLVPGWVAIWLLLHYPSLFLVAVVIGLAVWLAIVMDQRDHARAEATEAWFAAGGHPVDHETEAGLFRRGKGTR